MAGYSLDPIEDGCYPGTTVLINKYNIQTEQELADIETMVVSTKAAMLEKNPLPGSFDFAHYRAIHRFLFEDLYEWAGEVRKVNLSKKGTLFCPVEEIESRASKIFARLNKCQLFCNLPQSEYLEEIVDFYCVTNDLHPFREGNGRTQRSFLTQLIREAGYRIDFSEVEEDLLMIATIQAASGVTDLLKELFCTLIHFS